MILSSILILGDTYAPSGVIVNKHGVVLNPYRIGLRFKPYRSVEIRVASKNGRWYFSSSVMLRSQGFSSPLGFESKHNFATLKEAVCTAADNIISYIERSDEEDKHKDILKYLNSLKEETDEKLHSKLEIKNGF